jgi:transposase
LGEGASSAANGSDGRTIFTGWIYDHLKPHAEAVKVAHPLMLRAIAAPKKKNDRIDASKIADCLRCDFLPECHMVSREIRDRRRTLRYRQLLVRQMVQMKNRIAGLLMETGGEHNKQRLHKVGYFRELLSRNKDVQPSIRPLLKLSRETIERCQRTEYALVKSLQRDPLLAARIQRLRTIPGVGPITALTWAQDRGRCALPHDQAGHQLLRPLRRRTQLRGQGDAYAALQAAEEAYPASAGGSREAGSPTGP